MQAYLPLYSAKYPTTRQQRTGQPLTTEYQVASIKSQEVRTKSHEEYQVPGIELIEYQVTSIKNQELRTGSQLSLHSRIRFWNVKHRQRGGPSVKK